MDRWFSVFVKYLLCNSVIFYLRRIYTFNNLSGPKTSLSLLWCLGELTRVNITQEIPRNQGQTESTMAIKLSSIYHHIANSYNFFALSLRSFDNQ